MKDIKKLFQRDKWFWIVIIGYVALIFIGMLSENYQTQMIETAHAWLADDTFYGPVEVEEGVITWEMFVAECVYDACVMVIPYMFLGALILQIVKWQMFEGKRVREWQNALPIKASAHITYDYLNGIFSIWIPSLLVWLSMKGYEFMNFDKIAGILSIEAFLYSLFVFAKKVTNHIWGAFTFWAIVVYFEMLVTGKLFNRKPITLEWNFMEIDLVWIIELGLLSIVFVFLSYYCDRKRDLAGNGMFSFKIVHYAALLMLLIELETMFYGFYVEDGGGVLWYGVLNMVLAAGIVGGMHYLVKPKSV